MVGGTGGLVEGFGRDARDAECVWRVGRSRRGTGGRAVGSRQPAAVRRLGVRRGEIHVDRRSRSGEDRNSCEKRCETGGTEGRERHWCLDVQGTDENSQQTSGGNSPENVVHKESRSRAKPRDLNRCRRTKMQNGELALPDANRLEVCSPRLTLGELEPLACAGLAALFTLFHPRIASEETFDF